MSSSPPLSDLGQAGGASSPVHSSVLVVEDNIANFQLIARMLESIGMHCEWKTSGFEVLEYAEALPEIDLILMDIRLPYESGFEAGMKLRNSRRFRTVPIVGVSAVAGQDQIQTAKDIGFNGFLSKPLNPDKFPEQIRRVLAGEHIWEVT